MENSNPNKRVYKRISDEDRKRIIDSFESQDQDYVKVADLLNIKRESARSIIRNYLKNDQITKLKRGGAHNTKVDDGMKEVLFQIIEENPLLTLKEINKKLRIQLSMKPYVSDETIARTLDKMLITLKLCEDIPVQRNTVENMEKRYMYATWFLDKTSTDDIIYIDECGYNVWTRRTFGRALRGVPARRVVSKQKGQNLMCTFAINQVYGLMHSRIKVERVTKETFGEFIKDLITATKDIFPHDHTIYLVLDNARPHIDAQLKIPMEYINQYKIKYLPPYSPFLNPVEQYHSTFKSRVKSSLSEEQVNLGNWPIGLTQQQHRLDILLHVARDSILNVPQTQIFNVCQKPYNYMPQCIKKEEILG